MNKDELRGYLLACCDEIDRGIENDMWAAGDLISRLSEKIREYLKHENIYRCTYCGTEVAYGSIHICKTGDRYNVDCST